MQRPLAIVGAPSNIGIRPYDNGHPRRLDLAPNALREQGLVRRLRARDRGDIATPPYRELTRPVGRPRNEAGVVAYSRALASEVSAAIAAGDFVVTLGGDCSIVLGCLLGLRETQSRVGLVYVDAHADFATPEQSRTGSVASMCLALAVGRGDTPLARLNGAEPLVRGEDVVLIGRRDEAAAPWYGQDDLEPNGVLDLTNALVRERGPSIITRDALERLSSEPLASFWIHVDADVLDPAIMPAVDSPEPNGVTLGTLEQLLLPLVRHPCALGVELTIYDPVLDPDRAAAARLADLLEHLLASRA
ncbi:MAG: arginase family protein [Gemmatimonadaceae bacterium]